MDMSVPLEKLSHSGWRSSGQEVKRFCEILDEVIDDASHGWNPHLEDHVQWCVWSAPAANPVIHRLNHLAKWLMHWDMNKEAELTLRKALFCGVKLHGLYDRNSIRTLVLLSRAVWKQKRVDEALELLTSAGEAFSAIKDEGFQCDAMRCFVKVAAAYDALGWHRLAQEAWGRISKLL